MNVTTAEFTVERKRYNMHRYIKAAAFGLLWLAPQLIAGSKPELPPISTCYGQICLLNLRWKPPSTFFKKPDTTIVGSLVNRSGTTLSMVSLTFALISGSTLYTTATAQFPGDIPPGERWFFVASFAAQDGRVPITKSESVRLSYSTLRNPQSEFISATLRFDPLFSPFDRVEQKAWEKIHGKRQR